MDAVRAGVGSAGSAERSRGRERKDAVFKGGAGLGLQPGIAPFYSHAFNAITAKAVPEWEMKLR